MSKKPLNILLLCHVVDNNASTIVDHIEAIERYSGHHVHRRNMIGDVPIDLNFDDYQVIIIHYSLILAKSAFISPFSKSKLKWFKGLKVALIQDEYRWVNDTIRALKFVGIDLLYSCVPKKEQEKVYPKSLLPSLQLETTLTGFVPETLLTVDRPDYEKRTIDVGYRGRKISSAYGRLGQEKQLIAKGFSRASGNYKLKTDIAYGENDRLYGDNWTSFIINCKAMLGTESGASVFDFDGTVIPTVEKAESENPSLSFEELEKQYFPGLDGNIIVNQISPRCFECAALGTLMVLFEGDYSGILKPWQHYVPLKKDFSNIDKVVATLKNRDVWTDITNQAYDEIACNETFSFEKFAKDFGITVGDSYKDKFEKERKKHATLGVAHKLLVEDFDNLGSDYQSLGAEHVSLMDSFGELGDDYRVLGKEHESLVSEHENLVRSYKELGSYHKELGSHHKELSGIHEELQVHYKELQVHYKELQFHYKELQVHHHDLTGHYEVLNSSHNSLILHYEKINSDYDYLSKEYQKIVNNRRLSEKMIVFVENQLLRLLRVRKYPYYVSKALGIIYRKLKIIF